MTADPTAAAPLTGAQLIAQERLRQVIVEGYDSRHDDSHNSDELACAAARYALPSYYDQKDIWEKTLGEWIWPWSEDDFKPDQYRIRNLVKAGALLAAEIDRLQRIQRHE